MEIINRGFSVEGILSIALGIAGLVTTIWIFYSTVSKQLDLLLRTRRGELSKEQAKEFSIIYVDYIVVEIHRKVDQVALEFLGADFTKFEVLSKVMDHFEEIRRSLQHIRGQTTEFCLINGMTFKQFIEESNGYFADKISAGHKKLEALLNDVAEGKFGMMELKSIAHKEIEETAKAVKDIIKQELHKIYRDK